MMVKMPALGVIARVDKVLTVQGPDYHGGRIRQIRALAYSANALGQISEPEGSTIYVFLNTEEMKTLGYI